MADPFVNVELTRGVAWWLYHEVTRAHAEEKHNAWSPLSELRAELDYALHNVEEKENSARLENSD